jgi:hypothetical protein
MCGRRFDADAKSTGPFEPATTNRPINYDPILFATRELPSVEEHLIKGDIHMVENTEFGRRTFLTGAVGCGIATIWPATSFATLAPAPYEKGVSRFRSLHIDTQPLADKGLSNYAVRIRAMADPIARQVFAGRLDPKDPAGLKLILRIDSIQLGPATSGRVPFAFGWNSFGNDSTDWIEGAGVVVQRDGHVIAEKKTSTSANGSTVIPGDVLASERLRTQHLIEVLARWVLDDV